MTLQQLLQEGIEELKAAGIEEAELDARYLLMEAYGLDMVQFLMERNREMLTDTEGKLTPGGTSTLYRDLLDRRAGHIPLQYLCGTQEFMGLSFLVNPAVLIPRQDTETLVELVLKEQTDRNIRILDMCTGSGCIAVSLKKMGGYHKMTAADVSLEALKIARQNAERNGVVLELVESDLFSGIDAAKSQYEVIVSNPPYIPSGVIDSLQPEVRDHEPRLALDGMEDGLHFYRRLAAECGNYLTEGGSLYFEIGFDQAKDVGNLLKESGFTDIEVIKDGPGLDRVVKAVLVKSGGTYV